MSDLVMCIVGLRTSSTLRSQPHRVIDFRKIDKKLRASSNCAYKN